MSNCGAPERDPQTHAVPPGVVIAEEGEEIKRLEDISTANQSLRNKLSELIGSLS